MRRKSSSSHDLGAFLPVTAVAIAALLAGCPAPDAPPGTKHDAGLPEGQDAGDATAEVGEDVSSQPQAPNQPPVPTCSKLGPQVTRDPARAAVPWRIVAASDAADASTPPRFGRADAAIEGDSGCAHTAPDEYELKEDAVCRGRARAELVSGKLTALRFADGGRLVWDARDVPDPVAPPQLADGDMVWVDAYAFTASVCPFCGSYNGRRVEIRADEGGRILWIGQQGQLVGTVDDATVRTLFGVSAHRQRICHATYVADCWFVGRDVYDHVLETTPPQVLGHAVRARVVTPNGRYDVMWADSDEGAEPKPNCADGGSPAHDRAFAASFIGK